MDALNWKNKERSWRLQEIDASMISQLAHEGYKVQKERIYTDTQIITKIRFSVYHVF
jgi:hypothetical protein